jgi:hypothetical protein
MGRKREDSATVGDLEDLAKAIRDGVKDALGNVIPAPTPKNDGGDGKGGDGGDGKGGDGKGGDGGSGDSGGDHDSSWGFGGRWWGSGS